MKTEANNAHISKSLSAGEKAKRMLHKVNIPMFIGRAAMYILLIDLAFVFLYPFLYMIITSFKSPDDLVDITVTWIPREIYTTNFRIAFHSLNYIRGFINSTVVTLGCVVGHILACSMIAYGFARYKFPGRDVLFAIVILTLIVPTQVLVFPLFIQYSQIGLINTFVPLIGPTFLGYGLRGGLFIFIFRQFYLGLPYELEDAAKVDGCNAFKTYWSIVRPVAGSATLVTGILAMVWHWNDYLEPNLYINRSESMMLPANLPIMYNALNSATPEEFMLDGEPIYNEATVMAGTFMVILPILIVYMFLQRRFMEGIERTGIVG
ncbi:MAG: carbohydrate ABC transporter permease [Clostridia bacterium]|nr:carbohydrate ABC transporter permease [Clostridia bacterium]